MCCSRVHCQLTSAEKRTIAELHRQPHHRPEGLRVMMSLFCHSPQGSDLWANLGWSLQIPGLSLPGELLMAQWDGATMQQKSSQLTRPDIHLLWSHTQKGRGEKKYGALLNSFCSTCTVDAHIHVQAFVHALAQTNTHTRRQKCECRIN